MDRISMGTHHLHSLSGLLVLASITLAISSCANRSARLACEAADWSMWGYEDGAAGLDGSAFKKRKAPCKSEQVKEPDYRSGWEKGITAYCTPQRGFEAGLADQKYRDVCSGPSENIFLVEYTLGQKYRQIFEANKIATQEAAEARQSLARHRNQVRMARKRYENNRLSGDERYAARLDVDYHQREIDGLLMRIPKLHSKRNDVNNALREMEGELMSSGRIDDQSKLTLQD